MPARTIVAATLMSLSALAVSGAGAFAMDRGGSDNGDSYLNDMQRNPRYIEPYADRDPSRYRISNPQYGYGDRQRAAGNFSYGRADVFSPFGRVEVEPYAPQPAQRPYGPYYRP